MQHYETPELSVLEIGPSDVLTTSGPPDTVGGTLGNDGSQTSDWLGLTDELFYKN